MPSLGRTRKLHHDLVTAYPNNDAEPNPNCITITPSATVASNTIDYHNSSEKPNSD